jgi:hypothetical protein
MHHLHRKVAAALLWEREPAVAAAVEAAIVQRVVALGRLKELWGRGLRPTRAGCSQGAALL